MSKFNNILLATDSFKNSLSAEEVTSQIETGIRRVNKKITIDRFPFADGGEGSLSVLENFIDSERHTIYTFDALLKPIRAHYLYAHKERTAYIESALIIGLEVLTGNPDCYNASTYGLGIMIKDALDRGAESIVVFLGGSATCDGGIGMAAALGYTFYKGKRILERPLARDLKFITRFSDENVHSKIEDCEFIMAYDVENKLLGDNGSAFMYAKQKGASPEEIELLELGMHHLYLMGKEQKKVNVNELIGSGAAGGLGAGGALFLNAQLISAFQFLADITNLEEKIKTADLVITGEGHIDKQSFNGKLISKILNLAKSHQKQVWLICAIRSISKKDVLKKGFDRVYALYRNLPKEINIPETQKMLNQLGEKWGEEWKRT